MDSTTAKLHQFSEEYIDKDLTTLREFYDNVLFFGCHFRKLSGVTMRDCELNRSKIEPDTIRDLQNFTVTLSCKSFNNVVLNELAFDTLLLLLSKTAGNAEKRKKLLEIVGKDRARQILKEMETLE